MPQTMLALLAIVVASVFSFNQQRASIHTRMARINTEIQSHQLGIAAEILEHAQGLAFDEATIGRPLVPPGDLTAAEAFGAEAGESSFDQFDDLDDLAGMRHAVTRGMRDVETGGVTELAFEVEATVTFMEAGSDGQFRPTGTPTYHKAVEVRVQFPALAGPGVPTVRVARMFSYPR